MDIITAKLGANMAKSDLVASGQIGGEGQTLATIFADGTYVFETGVYNFNATAPLYSVGDTITVALDGVEYTSVVKLFEMGGVAVEYVGNPVMLGLEDNGMPFLMQQMNYGGTLFTSIGIIEELESETTQHTLAVYKVEQTITPIDPKYLPPSSGGGLPVVELTPAIELNGSAPLTTEESAMMDEMAAQGMPFICKCVLVEGDSAQTMTAVMNYSGAGGISMFVGGFAVISVNISNAEGSWVAGAAIL